MIVLAFVGFHITRAYIRFRNLFKPKNKGNYGNKTYTYNDNSYSTSNSGHEEKDEYTGRKLPITSDEGEYIEFEEIKD